MKTLTAIALALAISQVGCAFAKPKVKTTNKYEPKMKFIKGAYVIININKAANLKNNRVKVKSFWIAETETSFKQWQNCFKEGGCKKAKRFPNIGTEPEELLYGSTLPVVYVSWYEANEYTRWLSKISGKKYRLPTDAEWEYAARAGKKTLYPWGNRLIGIEKCKVCNYNSGGFLAPVDYNKPEYGNAPYGGLYYMYGNAAEWTCSPLPRERNKLPSGKENICLTPATYSSGDMKTKGGSYEMHFNSEAYEHRPDGQLDGARPPAKNFNWIGFRVIREAR